MKKLYCYILTLVFFTLLLSSCISKENKPNWYMDKSVDTYSINELYSINTDEYQSFLHKQIIIEFQVTSIKTSYETTFVCLKHISDQSVLINDQSYDYTFSIEAYTTLPYYENTLNIDDVVKIQGIIHSIRFDITNAEEIIYPTTIIISPCIVLSPPTQ